jgi:hypothetical protein
MELQTIIFAAAKHLVQQFRQRFLVFPVAQDIIKPRLDTVTDQVAEYFFHDALAAGHGIDGAHWNSG